MKLSQIRLLVDDFAESFRFWRDALREGAASAEGAPSAEGA